MAESITSDIRGLRDRLAERWASFRANAAARKAERVPQKHARSHTFALAMKWGGGLLLLAIIVFLALFDWNMLRGPVSRYASFRLHRQVRIEGNLHVHLWSWTPRIDVGGLHIANTKWAGGGDMANVGHLTISVKLLPLLGGNLMMPLVDLERSSFLYVRNMEGHSNWQFTKTTSNEPLKLPAINRFLINNGRVEITDARKKMHFTGTVSSSESTAGKGSGFVLTGDGTLNSEKFTADVRGAPLLNVDQSKPYPFTMNVHAGYTQIAAQGSITRPFDLGGINATASFAGRDAADLYYLTGLVLPNTPPYQGHASIVRDGELYKLENLTARIGRSDMSGAATVDASGEKPLVRADLHSRSVYFDDLGFLFGGGRGRRTAPRAPASTRNAAASSPGITLAGEKHGVAQTTLLLPDAPLDVDRVRQMNADVRYHADKIISRDFPLRSISVHLRLTDGILRLDPLSATLDQGTLAGRVKLDASRNVPVTTVDLRLRDLNLQQLFHPVRGQSTIEGNLDARAILTAAGDTLHKAASNANGSLTFVIPRGEMRKAFAELLGINLLNGGLALLTGDQTQTGIRCAVASFRAHDGVLNASNIMLDTDVERGTGRGSINLKNETMNLMLSGDAKSFRVLRMNAPITVTGTLSHPSIGVQASKAIGQGGLAVALGALVNPLAAVLATIDPGLARDANCGALMAHAKKKGAPVKTGETAKSGSSPLRTTPASEHVARRPRP
jgi:uncharacterized protein involved in outer membrane biogenesis